MKYLRLENLRYQRILKNNLVAFCLSLLYGCSSSGMCANNTLLEYFNRTKSNKVVKFDRDCGATTANSIQLSVVSSDESVEDKEGNIFIASSIYGKDFGNDTTVLVSWLNDTTIKVKYDSRRNLFKKQHAKDNFRIVYEEMLIN